MSEINKETIIESNRRLDFLLKCTWSNGSGSALHIAQIAILCSF